MEIVKAFYGPSQRGAENERGWAGWAGTKTKKNRSSAVISARYRTKDEERERESTYVKLAHGAAKEASEALQPAVYSSGLGTLEAIRFSILSRLLAPALALFAQLLWSTKVWRG